MSMLPEIDIVCTIKIIPSEAVKLTVGVGVGRTVDVN
jgi:hypothetical protein